MSTPSAERSIGGILRDILGNLQSIVRSEVQLVKTEFGEQVRRARTAAILLTIAAAFALFSVVFLLVSATFALAQVMQTWEAALAVAGGVAVVAVVLLAIALSHMRKLQPMPRSAASIRENFQWKKHRAS